MVRRTAVLEPSVLNFSLAANPSFEEDSNSDQVPDGWVRETTDSQSALHLWSADHSFAGTGYSGEIQSSRESAQAAWVSEDFISLTHREYQFSAYIKTREVTGQGAGIGVVFYDVNKEPFVPDEIDVEDQVTVLPVSGTKDWEKIEIDSLVIPEGAAFVKLRLFLDGSGSVWFDEVLFMPVGDEFETGREPVDPFIYNYTEYFSGDQELLLTYPEIWSVVSSSNWLVPPYLNWELVFSALADEVLDQSARVTVVKTGLDGEKNAREIYDLLIASRVDQGARVGVLSEREVGEFLAFETVSASDQASWRTKERLVGDYLIVFQTVEEDWVEYSEIAETVLNSFRVKGLDLSGFREYSPELHDE